MEAQPDFRELLESFHSNGVEYLIVGAYALAFHGVPRTTGDLDVLVKPDAANAVRVHHAIREFGFDDVDLSPTDFEAPERVVQLGLPPVRIDILTSITGVSWEDADRGAQPGEYGGLVTRYLGLHELRANKRALGRAKDRADLEALGDA
jgi:hypothetical protein